MAPEENIKQKVGRRLTKKRMGPHIPSVKLPERFKDGDDAQQDVTATKGINGQYMNQSVFSMIAAAGSKVDFHSRFDDESSGSDEEGEALSSQQAQDHLRDTPAQEDVIKPHGEEGTKSEADQHRRKPSRHKLFRSIPKLNLRTTKEKNYMSRSTHSPFDEVLSPIESPRRATPRDAPVMSRMLEAEALLSSSPTNLDQTRRLGERLHDVPQEGDSSSLAIRLMEIFGYGKPEEVVAGASLTTCSLHHPLTHMAEYPCWLLQSVLLQGYMYITENHICFYAYLPKKAVSYSPCLFKYERDLRPSRI